MPFAEDISVIVPGRNEMFQAQTVEDVLSHFEERIANIDGLLGDAAAPTTTIAVGKPGRYRLFAYAFDDHGHAADANIPFLVEPGEVR